MNESTMVNTDQLLCNVRRCKELPIEARHTICLEISKKRRQRVASRTSVFIPKELSYINYRKMFQRYEKNLSTSKKKFKSRLLNSRVFYKKLGALKNTTNRITKSNYNQTTKLKNQIKKPNHNRQNHQKNQQQIQKRRLKQHKLTHPESFIIPQKLSPILIGERIRSAVKNLRKDVSSTKLFALSNNKQLVEQQIQLGTDQNFTISYTVEMPTDNRPPQTLSKSPGKTISILDELPGANNVIDNSELAPTQKSYLEIIGSDHFIRNELLEATKADDYACVPIPNNNSTIDNYNNNNSIVDNYNNNNSIIDNYNNCNNINNINNNSNNENNYHSLHNNINRDNNNNNSNNKTKCESISSNCYEQHQQVPSVKRSFPNSEFGNWNYYDNKAPEINQANLTAAMEQLQLAQVLPTNHSTGVTSRENVVHYNTMSSTIPSPATAYSNFVAQEKELSRQNMFGYYQADPITPRSSDAVDDYPGPYSNIMDQKFVQHANYQRHNDSLCYDHGLSGGTCNMPSNRNSCSSNIAINTTAKKERRKRPKINYARQSHHLHEDNNCEADSTTPLNTNTYPSRSRHLVNGLESFGRLSKVMDLASTNDKESIDMATMYKQQQHQQKSIHHPAVDYHQQQPILDSAVYQQQQPILDSAFYQQQQPILDPAVYQQQQPIHHPVAHHPTVHHPVALHPTVHYPVALHPLIHQPVDHHPAVQHLTAHHLAAHHPTPHHLTTHHLAVHYPTLHHQQLQPILHPALYHQQQLQHPILLHQQQSDVLNQQSVLQPALHPQQQQQDKQIPFLYYQQQFEERIQNNHNQQQYNQLSLLHQQLIHHAADKFAATYPTQVRYPHFTSPLTTADPPSSGVGDPRHYYHQLSLDNGCCHQQSPSALHEIKRMEKLF